MCPGGLRSGANRQTARSHPFAGLGITADKMKKEDEANINYLLDLPRLTSVVTCRTFRQSWSFEKKLHCKIELKPNCQRIPWLPTRSMDP